MARPVKQTEVFNYSMPIIVISKDELLPVAPLFLIAALKNNSYDYSFLNESTTLTQKENNINIDDDLFAKYFSLFQLSGVYQKYGDLEFKGQIKLNLVRYSPEDYAKEVLNKYFDNSYDTLEKLLYISGFSKYLIISILFLLNENKISINDLNQYYKMQISDIIQEIENILFSISDLDYHTYLQPIEYDDINIDINQYKSLTDIEFKIELKNKVSLMRPLVLSTINKQNYTPEYEEFYLYYNNDKENIPEKFKFELSMDDVRQEFPLIRKITNNTTDIFLNKSHSKFNITPTADTLFYTEKNFPEKYEDELFKCDYVYYLDYESEPFPEVFLFNANDRSKIGDFKIQLNDNNLYTISELITKYDLINKSTLMLIARYKDYEMIYLINPFEIQKSLGILSNSKLADSDINKICETAQKKVKELKNPLIQSEFNARIPDSNEIYNNMTDEIEEPLTFKEFISLYQKEIDEAKKPKYKVSRSEISMNQKTIGKIILKTKNKTANNMFALISNNSRLLDIGKDQVPILYPYEKFIIESFDASADPTFFTTKQELINILNNLNTNSFTIPNGIPDVLYKTKNINVNNLNYVNICDNNEDDFYKNIENACFLNADFVYRINDHEYPINKKCTDNNKKQIEIKLQEVMNMDDIISDATSVISNMYVYNNKIYYTLKKKGDSQS